MQWAAPTLLVASPCSFEERLGETAIPSSVSPSAPGSFFCLKGLKIHGVRAFMHRSQTSFDGFLGHRIFCAWHRSQAARRRMVSSAIVYENPQCTSSTWTLTGRRAHRVAGGSLEAYCSRPGSQPPASNRVFYLVNSSIRSQLWNSSYSIELEKDET